MSAAHAQIYDKQLQLLTRIQIDGLTKQKISTSTVLAAITLVNKLNIIGYLSFNQVIFRAFNKMEIISLHTYLMNQLVT